MIVYKCIISGDEFISDSYPLKEVIDDEGNKIDGLMYCESKLITKSGDDIDVGCGNAFGSGGDDEGVDNTAVQVNNVIDSFQYTETQVGTANDFKAWIKEYMNAVVTKLREKGKPKEDIKAFKDQAPNIAKFFLKKYSDVQFYLGPGFNSESMVFSIYPDGALTPNFYFIMGGLVAEKF